MQRILFFMHLVQDLDLLEPILREVQKRSDCRAAVCATDRLCNGSARLREMVASLPVEFQKIPYGLAFFGLSPLLKGFSALVTAAESSARPHRVAYVLTRRANRQGMRTYTLQQGIENIGLNDFNGRGDPLSVRFASQVIFTWGPLSLLDSRVPEETRRRCVPVGCPKEAAPWRKPQRRPEWGSAVIAVFENLHRSSYDRPYIENFLSDLKKTADSFPEIAFLLKPHHNQRWAAIHKRRELEAVKNIFLADPQDPEWEPFTAGGILAICEGAITTPSTVALDAARAGRPVAVAGYTLASDKYQPLSILRSVEDWAGFVRRILHSGGQREEETAKGALFLDRMLIPGPAAPRIVDAIVGNHVG